jgi:4-hydroxybenzoate polyprenyltransferase
LIPSALCDVLAGFALAGGSLVGKPSAELPNLLWTLLGSAFLYSMGMVLNDLAGLKQDKALGRNKPLVLGEVLSKDAFTFGIGLFLLGNLALFLGDVPLLFAGSLTLAILLYDLGASRLLWPLPFWLFISPLFLGICRSMNLCLGLILLKDDLGTWPIPLLVLGVYFLYTVFVGLHGRLEDFEGKASPLLSRFISVFALMLFFIPPAFLDLPWVGVLMLPSLIWVLGKRKISSRTGELLKGFSRFGFLLALGSKAYLIAGICGVPAWILPFFVRRKWT